VLIVTGTADAPVALDAAERVAAAELAVELELLLPQAAITNATPTSVPRAPARILALLQLAIIVCSRFAFSFRPVIGAVITTDSVRSAILPAPRRELAPPPHYAHFG
jgi:hypothetical protein